MHLSCCLLLLCCYLALFAEFLDDLNLKIYVYGATLFCSLIIQLHFFVGEKISFNKKILYKKYLIGKLLKISEILILIIYFVNVYLFYNEYQNSKMFFNTSAYLGLIGMAMTRTFTLYFCHKFSIPHKFIDSDLMTN